MFWQCLKSDPVNNNTVRKRVAMSEERGLIITEPTAITTQDGRKCNSSLLYAI